MRILDSTKSLSVLVNDNTNGLGTIQPLECTVTEELNGIYECEFTVLTTDKHYEDLKSSGLIKVKVGNGSEQIFRVYFISEPINFVVSVKAQHITYDLSKIVVKPFTATGAVNIKNQLVSHMLGSYPFTTWTDIANTTSTFTLDIPRSFRECLGGYEGSVLDVLRCEYEWDNLTVKLYAQRGHDNGVRIAYGKNLTDFVQEQNNENVYDAVYGYAVVNEVTYEASGIYNKTGASTPKVLNVDFSSSYENQTPTPADLLAKATQYAQNNPIEVPNVNIKIDFVPLWQTEEYKDILQLERVSLGDTVHVYFDKLNVEASARVIKTVWNVLTEKYDSIELGDAKATLDTIINSSVKEAVDEMDVDVGWLDEKLNTMTTLIANGLGLHITQDEVGRIILHNAETIAESQYQYMITASGFMLSDDYGQSWTSGWTTSGDAVMNSLSTITLRALEIYGSYIQGSQMVFGDPTVSGSQYIIVQPYSGGVTFDGTGAIRMQPQGEFNLRNIGSNNSTYNSMYMNHASTQNIVTMTNYGYSDSTKPTNSFTLGSYSSQSAITMVNYKMGSNLVANRVQLFSMSTAEQMVFTNYRLSADETANTLTMASLSTNSSISLSNYNSGGSTYGNYITLLVNDGGDNNLHIQNNDSSGTAKNYIDMSAANNMMHIWSRSDLYLQSDGAVRIYSSGSQDITLNANDDLHLNFVDKLYLNGTQVYLSDGYVRYYT